ncbi:monooxygenase [Lentinus brumalis]|uniref:Monooxygenase n=1 Tax=Lentinus brumalis TaxID=2498619 RepID=A0A371DPZ4_9APHY|nr:monooxygenase [Polyporus brumalis]
MANTTQTSSVLIIGAGPSGLAAALTLAQNGIPIRIIDKATEFHKSSRGGGLHPRTMEFYRFLGVAQDAKSLGRPLPPVQMYKLPGGTEVVANWKLFEDMHLTPDRPEETTTVSQYINEGIFRDHLSKYGVHVELGTEPASIEQDASGVTVSLKHAGVDEAETARFVYVIGADGARGFTRKAIGAKFEGETKEADGQTWADIEVEGISSDFWHVWTETGKFSILMRPKKEPGKFHVGIVGQDFDPADLATDPTKFCEFFYANTGRKDILLKNFTSLTYWKPKMRMVNKLYDGRVFLCGDIAHVHSPTGGQGLNTGVGDSFNLAWKVALVYKGLASPELLATYQTERMPVIAHVLAVTSNLYTGLVHRQQDDSPARSTKEATSFFKWRNNALRQLEVNYRWSPVVFDARGILGMDEQTLQAHAYEGYPGESVRAGDRAPDAPGLADATGSETSLFDIFKPYKHTLLIFAPEQVGSRTEEVVAAARNSPLGSVIQTLVLDRHGVPAAVEGASAYHDKEGHAHKAYGVDEETLSVVVVRPDGYIGAFVNDVDGLQAYFTRIARGPVV